MSYDLFISYSRADNLSNRVTELKEKIETEYLEFAKEELKCFFDKDEIKGMEDWKQRLLQGLKDSHLLLLILSPNYLASKYCDWEIVEYLKYEYARATQGDGVAQIYFLEIPGLDEPGFEAKARVWIEKISRRQRFDFRPWYDEGADSLKEIDVRNRLEELKKSLHDRIRRMRRIADAPGNLPAPNARFVGREREMKLLHESVGLGKFGVLTAVHGMGGLGKTAIAFQYAYAYADFYPGGRWQIGCANETNLASVLKKLNLDLNVTFTEDEKKDDIRGAKRIINELETRAIKGAETRAGEKKPPKPAVLLLLDNVDHAELIQPPYANLISGKEWLKVLVTTRMGPEELGADETRQALLNIDELPFDDALSLMESYQPGGSFKNEEEKEKAGEIVKLLDCFTLAVEVAALYLYECNGRVSCADFLELLKRKGIIEGIDFAGDKTKAALNHTKFVSATLAPTLDLLSPAELLVLGYAALLQPDSIPLPWIKALATKDFPELGQEAEIGEDDPWLLIINHLLSLRLLQIVDFDRQTPRIVKMHRVVQETLHKRYTRNDELRQKLCDLGLQRSDYLNKQWHIKQEQWEIKPLVDFADHLLQLKHFFAPKFVKWLGQWLLFINSFQKYKELHLKAIELLKQDPDTDQTEIAILLSNLGVVSLRLGNVKEARIHLKMAMEIDEKFRDPTHQFLAIRYYNLAGVEKVLGNLKEAKELFLKALAILEKVFDKDHPDLAKGYHSLAGVEQVLGNLKDAKELCLKALAIQKKALDKDHPDLATGYSYLAIVEQDLGNLKEAKELFLKALAIREKVFDKDHPNLAISYNDIGSVVQVLGNLKEAKELFLKALAIREKAFDEDHPDLAAGYSNLAKLEQDLGNLKEAKELHLKALAIREKVFDKDHPDLAISYNNLGKVEQDLGNLKEAKELFLKALYHDINHRGQTHPKIAHRLNNLTSILIMQGNYNEARQNLFQAWNIKANNHDLTSRRILFFCLSIAFIEKCPGTVFIGQLKTLFKFKQDLDYADVVKTWDVNHFIEFISERVSSVESDFLINLSASMNDYIYLEKLDKYEFWVNQPEVSLATPWPK